MRRQEQKTCLRQTSNVDVHCTTDSLLQKIDCIGALQCTHTRLRPLEGQHLGSGGEGGGEGGTHLRREGHQVSEDSTVQLRRTRRWRALSFAAAAMMLSASPTG